jgi:hypothetical protein
LALSRDKRKNPQKECSGSPEGAIFDIFEKSLAIIKLPENFYIKTIKVSI